MESKTYVIIRRASTILPNGEKTDSFNKDTKSWIAPALSWRTNKYYTGLTEAEEDEYERDLGKPKGTLKPTSNFWEDESLVIKIIGDSDKVYIDGTLGQLKYKAAKANPMIAPSKDEYNPEKHKFIMYEPEIELEKDSNKLEIELEAIEKFNKLSTEKARDISSFYNLSILGVEDKQIKINLYKKVKEKPKLFLQILNDPYYKNKVFINKCVRADVINKSNKGYFWPNEKVAIAVTMDKFVEILEDKDNQDILLNMKQQLANKTTA